MTTIKLEIAIKATRDVCFDLSRSVDVHLLTTQHTNEKAIGGCTRGLIDEGEWVKWKAKHFLIDQTMTVQIKEMRPFRYFVDEMIQGPFTKMKHQHFFSADHGRTIMSDTFEYEVPYGIAGRIFDKLVLRNYLRNLLKHRNRVIKKLAESGEWKRYLDN